MGLLTLEICAGVGMLGEGLQMKVCARCKESKPVAAFTKRKRGSGYFSYCHPCQVERTKPKDQASRDRHKARNVAYRAKIRADMLQALGGKCECCGESTPEFLALDHRHGGGTKERKTLANNTSGGVYRIARDAGYPKDKYRLLCHNCNCAIGWYGYCPHQKENACG
jgi:hypothetical protein